MAVNPNGSLPNRNTLYVGSSGSGKSQCLKQNDEIPRKGVRHLLYDPNEDHIATRYGTMSGFKRGLYRALKSGRGFRVAFTGGSGEADHEEFCRVVWSILDGSVLTFVTDEELSDSCAARTGKAAPEHAKLLNQGRKYGLRYHGVIQFPTEVPKTVYRNCWVKYAGYCEPDAAEYTARQFGGLVSSDDLSSLEPLNFWKIDPGVSRQPVKVSFPYRSNL